MTTKNTNSRSWRLRLASTDEINNWDDLIVNNFDGGNFLQSRAFAAIKSKDGWTPHYFIYEKDATIIAALGLTRSIFCHDDLWYFPKGPGVSQKDFSTIVEVTRHYVQLHNPNVFLIQMEPEWCEALHISTGSHLTLGRGIQAHSSTVVVSLNRSLNDIFDSFSKRARYGARLGERENIQIKSVTASEESFRTMYALMKTVAGGKGVAGIRPYVYYRRFWQTYMSSGAGQLYFAYENGIPVVGAFVILFGDKSFYKDGGSTPGRKSKGASYFLQWRIIQDMKAVGVTSYDMLGTPPSSRRDDKSHRLYGVGLFKTAFSHAVVDYPGVYNCVLSSWKYTCWRKCIYPLMRRVLGLKNNYFY